MGMMVRYSPKLWRLYSCPPAKLSRDRCLEIRVSMQPVIMIDNKLTTGLWDSWWPSLSWSTRMHWIWFVTCSIWWIVVPISCSTRKRGDWRLWDVLWWEVYVVRVETRSYWTWGIYDQSKSPVALSVSHDPDRCDGHCIRLEDSVCVMCSRGLLRTVMWWTLHPVGGLIMYPLQSRSASVTWTMGGLRVFQPFPQRHCKTTRLGSSSRWCL